ncbi:hypothetical protein VA596_42275 [Amycolatopsis sp., V23-08]|uniref:Chromosome partitioning protein n=1 Tax=Amycolatopsis heterodermiae TaxID=3110235 RepID=A0ABU5RIW8_9PSEU|nr:hypothetical protein [Amycolatopsis sp., V23-08]MEA5366217.1 hypothetical protein [Amycolatopsis sp., V23-08]
MGIELVVGALFAWAVGKARRAGKVLDGVADEVTDAAAARAREKILEAVLGKLGTDPAVRKLETEVAESGEVSERTRRRVTDAVEDAVEDDESFAAQLASAISEAEHHPSLVAAQGGIAVSGMANASGQGSIAIGAAGRDVTVHQPPDPHRPGRA